MIRVALYARYSSENQREASIADQIRECRRFAKARGWTVVEEYSDAHMTGSNTFRPGYQALVKAALDKQFDRIVSESLDRLSRDQEDTAGLFKRLTFAGVDMWTLAEGEIGAMAVGFKGTMNALYLKDLVEKTRRGMRGLVEQGKSGGGLCYGYSVTAVGDRAINAVEAKVVIRIFEAYANGASPLAIAKALNAEGVPGPRGAGTWGPSTIHGHAVRGTGILNNELYIGRLIWNRRRWLKDPDTGRRVPRENPPDQWTVTEVPALRVVSDTLWRAVKAKQGAMAQGAMRKGATTMASRRPVYIFSGLIKCGVCGRGYVVNNGKLTCGGYKQRGTCENSRRVSIEEVDGRVLTALQEKFFAGPHFEVFCQEFTAMENEVRMERRGNIVGAERELANVRKGIAKMVDTFAEYGPVPELKDKWNTLQARKLELEATLATAEEPGPLLHPKMADVFREEVIALRSALMEDNRDDAARQSVRKMVEEIRVTPRPDGTIAIDVTGDIAAMLTAASPGDWSGYTKMVAGARVQFCIPKKVAA